TEILVIGGGASGTAAAIQAARSGAEVLLVEETPWLGGMLTAAGVSATDGNHRLPSGLWGEFRQALYDHYGGPDSVFTGWVSNTQFEPAFGNQVWQQLANAVPKLKRLHGFRLISVQTEGKRISGATFQSLETGEVKKVKAEVVIEATELGDVLGMGNVPHWIGQDTPEDPHNPHVQDLTYAAILQEYPAGETDHLLARPEGYDSLEFECFCLELCPDGRGEKLDCQQVLGYAKLPNDKYMLNWPRRGNDYYVDATRLSYAQRDSVYELAKKRTLELVYFIQTEVGFAHIGLAKGEFPTADQLPLIPYHREARRIRGLVCLEVPHLEDPYADLGDPLYQHGVAVGDYPLDHHHDKNPNAAPETFPPIPSFSIPYECLVPKEIDGLIVAEKSISVSHMVNGASRLQPCVITIGQAAGAAAALAVSSDVAPREVPIRALQEKLLAADCWILPWLDVQPEDWFFESAMRAGVRGWMRGHGVPYQWANQTWFYPDSAVRRCEVPNLTELGAPKSLAELVCESDSEDLMTRSEMVLELWSLFDQPTGKAVPAFEDVTAEATELKQALAYFQEQGWLANWAEGTQFDGDAWATRKEMAWLLDQAFIQK
ncbi:MAG: FAD-dependent oxidoreductase, partial [Bacteroidota bacterium]